jgi:hypothetical protein
MRIEQDRAVLLEQPPYLAEAAGKMELALVVAQVFFRTSR